MMQKFKIQATHGSDHRRPVPCRDRWGAAWGRAPGGGQRAGTARIAKRPGYGPRQDLPMLSRESRSTP